MVRIVVTPVNSEDLQHGDLYSSHDQAWWDGRDSVSIGHYVVLRNNNPFPAGYEGRTSYKVTIEPDPPDEKIISTQLGTSKIRASRPRDTVDEAQETEDKDDEAVITG